MTNARGQILVVERDPTLGRELVEQLLADGYPAELAENVGRATVTASARVPQLVVLGELDPPRSALEILQRIRGSAGTPTSHPWRADLPVIVLDSHSPDGRAARVRRGCRRLHRASRAVHGVAGAPARPAAPIRARNRGWSRSDN